VSKILVKVTGSNVLSTLVQASKTYRRIDDTKDASTFDFFPLFFSHAALTFVPVFYFFLSKVLQNQNAIQSNQQISYQSDTNSLLNILQLI
jgi:hypothetical protein